jgi:uncharacterized membrane protein
MNTPARVAGHPIHPMLVSFPIGLWVFSFVCDIGYVLSGSVFWTQAAYVAIVGGIVGAFAAAVPGLIDFWSLRSAEVFKTALAHMAFNVLALVLFIVSLLSRSIGAPNAASMWMSAIGIIALLISGWLGGELVFVRGIAVEGPAGAAHRR